LWPSGMLIGSAQSRRVRLPSCLRRKFSFFGGEISRDGFAPFGVKTPMEDSRRDIIVLNTDTGRLVRRIDGQIRQLGDMVFVPVEDLLSLERSEPRFDLLQLVTDMEILALAAR